MTAEPKAPTDAEIKRVMTEWARRGGLTTGPKRAAASRRNGKLGGRPKGRKPRKKKAGAK